MRHWIEPRRLPAVLGLALAGLAAGAVLLAWSGLYSVAASRGHWRAVEWLLAFGMRNSVETNARGITPPPLGAPALARRAAGHFATACAICHGAPDAPRSPIVRGMLPEPPELPGKVGRWSDAELFWIVKHGLKYTGMPAWPAQQRDDEVWAMVAFLRRLPGLTSDDYRRLAGDPATGPLGGCSRCHGRDGLASDSAFPRLAGQSEAYLLDALRSYAEGRRGSGIMQTAVAGLGDATLQALARHYAAQPAPAGDRGASDAGRVLVEQGDPRRNVPACGPCHGPARQPRYPNLAGQPVDYLSQQLRLWRAGSRGGSAYAPVMTQAAKGLTDEQIEAVAAYYADAALPPRALPGEGRGGGVAE